MTGTETVALADIFVALLLALAIVAFVSRRFAVPYTAALVVFGLLVAILAPPDVIEITPEVVLVVLVPGLVFEAAFRLDFGHVRPTLAASTIPVPGVHPCRPGGCRL
jgi:CPA1 family monovalent cation:H+ antiporter